MTITDAMLGAAALWLLFVLCGLPNHRTGVQAATGEDSAAAMAPNAEFDVVPYSVWYQDVPQPRHVTPPLPDEDVGPDGIAGTKPENTNTPPRSTAVCAIGLPQTLSLTEITIPSGGRLALANLGGSELIVLRTGWLELSEREGNVLVTRSPLAESRTPRQDEGLPTTAPGDRISFAPGATVVLRNRGATLPQLIAASVLTVPGLTA